jgi:hypothetical protein
MLVSVLITSFWDGRSMIKLLEDAIAKLRQLPEGEQESVAHFVLHELHEDQEWRRAKDSPVNGTSSTVFRLMSDS